LQKLLVLWLTIYIPMDVLLLLRRRRRRIGAVTVKFGRRAKIDP